LPFGDEIRPAGVEILPPSGETIRKNLADDAGAQAAEFRYDATHDIGIYTLRMLQGVSAKQIAYAVNVDPDESLPTKVKREDLEEMFAPAPLVFADNPDDLSETFKLLKQGRSLWGLFLTAVLVALVFETFVSNWLSPKPDDDAQLQALPPGMRRLAAGAKKG